MNYEVVTMIVPAADLADINLLLDNSEIEGCTKIFGRPCWPEDTELVYDEWGCPDLAKCPPPTHHLSSGWMHVDAIALLPEAVLVPDEPVVSPQE